MIDGQPDVTPEEKPSENVEEQTAQTKVVQETEENIPEKFRGKSKSDIAHSYAELENKFSTTTAQLSEMQRQWEDFQRQQTYEAQMKARSQNQPSEQSEPDPTETDYYGNPVGYTRKIAERTTAKMLDESQKRTQQQMRYAIAYNSADSALSEARRTYPQAFSGMNDQEVAQLKQGIMQNVSSGGVAPEVLSSPNAWAGAATLHRGLKTGFKFSPSTEVSTNPTESPASVRQPERSDEEFSADEKTQRMMREMGLTKEQQTGAIKRAGTAFQGLRR